MAARSDLALETAPTLLPALAAGPLGGYLRAQHPDLYISVHPLLNHMPLRLLHAAGNYCPAATVVTDLGGGHPTWFCPDIDLITVGSQALYDLGLQRGVPRSRLRLLGLPVNPRVSAAPARSGVTAPHALNLAEGRPRPSSSAAAKAWGLSAEITRRAGASLDRGGRASRGHLRAQREAAAPNWPAGLAAAGGGAGLCAQHV